MDYVLEDIKIYFAKRGYLEKKIETFFEEKREEIEENSNKFANLLYDRIAEDLLESVKLE